MFEWMNKHKKDIMTYTLWLVIPSFIVLYGYGECKKPERVQWVAKVNGEQISEIQWSEWMENIRNRLQQYGRDIESEELRTQALDAAIVLALNEQKAEAFGVNTLDEEVAQSIKEMPYFKDQAGNFNIQIFYGVMNQLGRHPIQFEEEQRKNLTRTKLQSLISHSLFPADSEVKRMEEREKQQVEVEYLAFEPSRYVQDVTADEAGMQAFFEANKEDFRIPDQRRITYARFFPSQYVKNATYSDYQLTRYFDEHRESYRVPEAVMVEHLDYKADQFVDVAQAGEEEIQQYFEQNPDAFMHPTQVKIRYITQSLAELIKKETVSDETIQNYYQDNIKRFTHGEQAKARHILLRVTQGISADEENAIKNRLLEIRQEIADGLPFEEAAKKYSQGPSAEKGGDLGYFEKGRMVPPFEKAAFELPLGQVSEPVKTAFGYHLIFVEDRKEEGTDPLDEVRDTISETLRKRQALETFRKKMADIQSLDSLSGQYDIQETDWFARGDEIPGLSSGERSLVSSAAFGNFDSSPCKVVGYPQMEHIFVIERLGKMESRPMTLEEARDQVAQAVKKVKAADLARNAAQADLDRIRSASLTLDAIAQERNIELKTSDYFSRNDPYVRGFGVQPTEMISTAFTLNEGELGGPVKTQAGYHLLRLVARDPEHIPELDEVRQQVEKDCLQYQAEQHARILARQFGDQLFNQATRIDIVAASSHVDWGTTGLFTLQDPLPGIGQQPVINYNAFQMQAVGDISNPVAVSPRNRPRTPNAQVPVEAFYVLQLDEIKDSYLPELAEVQDDVEQKYKLLLAEKVAERHAAEALKEIQAALASSSPVSATQSIELQQFEDVENAKPVGKGGLYRGPYTISGNGTVSGIGGRPWSFTKTALALQPGQVSGLVKCYGVKTTKEGERIQGPMLGVYILQVLGKSVLDKDTETQPRSPADSLKQSLQSIAYEAWVEEASAAASIEYNRKVLFPEEFEEDAVDSGSLSAE